MIKKQQKWIALPVIFTFIWLLQVSTLPLAAVGITEQSASANAEHAPGFVEAAGHGAAPARKSILPIILIGVGVVAVAAVLFLVVLKKTYDIRGTWTVNAIWSGSSLFRPFTLVFAGSSREAGTFMEQGIFNGTYTADGKDVTWIYTDFPDENMVFTGKFTGKDAIEGTMSIDIHPFSGTFTAIRTASAAGIGNSGPGGLDKKIK